MRGYAHHRDSRPFPESDLKPSDLLSDSEQALLRWRLDSLMSERIREFIPELISQAPAGNVSVNLRKRRTSNVEDVNLGDWE